MEKITYILGITNLEVVQIATASGPPLLRVDLPGPRAELTPDKARVLAALLTIAADDAAPPKPKVRGIWLYATIRPESKYWEQQQKDRNGRPVPFPVTIEVEFTDSYWVKGGAGGCYTFFDVILWKKINGKLESLPIHGSPYTMKFSEMCQTA